MKSKVKEHCQDDKDVENFATSGMTDFMEASKEVASQKGNHRSKHEKLDKLVIGFADRKMKRTGHQLSAMLAYLYHLSPDFRNEGQPFPNFTEEEKQSAREYIAGEQEIVRMTGLANKDNTITLFRNTDEKQLGKGNSKTGYRGNYRGNNLESWTTNPDLGIAIDGQPKSKVMANIPLYAVVASCIGREKGKDFEFKDKGECEIMVCGAFVKDVIVVGDNKGIDAKKRISYLKGVKRNMQRFSQIDVDESRKSSMHRRIRLTRRLWDL